MPQPAPLLSFNGAIEGAPVFWSAPTHQALRAQCQDYMGRSGFGNVDDIQIFGVADATEVVARELRSSRSDSRVLPVDWRCDPNSR